jgi:hypothetical protein
LVPGFERWGETWLKHLPAGADPRRVSMFPTRYQEHEEWI